LSDRAPIVPAGEFAAERAAVTAAWTRAMLD